VEAQTSSIVGLADDQRAADRPNAPTAEPATSSSLSTGSVSARSATAQPPASGPTSAEVAAASQSAAAEPVTLPPAATELQRLMLLADRYARRLISSAGAPADALMLVHHGALDVLPLDGAVHVTALVCRLLAQRQASSAVLMLTGGEACDGPAAHAYHIIGETADGLRDAWHYRVRRCGATRRLTRQLDPGPASEQEPLPYPLFVHRPPVAATTAPASGTMPIGIA
jgi:hypothetical protein